MAFGKKKNAAPEIPEENLENLTEAPGAIPPPNGYVPGEEQKGFKEVLRILKERRLLRKDLKSKGIKSRKDFEKIAESLGLVLWKKHPFLLWWHYTWVGFLSRIGLGTILSTAAALLAVTFFMSTVTEEKGSFTINLTAEMLRAGFVLYDTAEFQEAETRLFSDALQQVNNITLSDIPLDVDDIDGPHNGKDYIAYTFYIRNEGSESADYAWYLNFLADTLDVGSAVWIMLFQDGTQVLYAQEMENGKAEELYGFSRAPFSDVAYAYDDQYYQEDELYGIRTTPYAADDIVAQGIVRDVAPGEAHKYTVVIWIEGHDPDCTDALFGGYAKYAMDFDNVSAEEDDHIFAGLFRTEYENYGLNPDSIQGGRKVTAGAEEAQEESE